MAFLADDDDAMHAFEAALSFMDNFIADEPWLADAPGDGVSSAHLPVANGSELPLNGTPEHASDSNAAIVVDPAQNARRKPRRTLTGSSASNGNSAAARPVSEAVKTRRREADNARKRMLRKAGVYGDPNRARNERKIEIAYLREKVGQLEWELQHLQERTGHSTTSKRLPTAPSDGQGSDNCVSGAMDATGVQVSSIWKGFAARQRARREKAERENVRLKLVLEGQIKVAKSLESLLLKRAQQQGVDAVLASNGLATMEMTQQDIHMREGVDGMYLEVFSSKVMPFGLHATAEATWNYFKGSEKHRGNLYAKAAQNLDTPYTIIEHFSKELFAGNSSTDVRVKQIIRRYVEADREVVVWVATITPVEIKRKAFSSLAFHHRNYAVIKRAKDSTPERELSLLQLVSHVTLDSQEGTVYDPKYIRALTDFLLSNAAGNIKADQELIENVLMDQTLQQH